MTLSLRVTSNVSLLWDAGEAGGGTALHSPVYHLLAADLRNPPTDSLAPLLASESEPLLSPSLPTLLLFECVLAYMRPEASNATLQWFTNYFTVSQEASRGVLGCIVYEMFSLEDAFGKVMVNNLKVSALSSSSNEQFRVLCGHLCPGNWCSQTVVWAFLRQHPPCISPLCHSRTIQTHLGFQNMRGIHEQLPEHMIQPFLKFFFHATLVKCNCSRLAT